MKSSLLKLSTLMESPQQSLHSPIAVADLRGGNLSTATGYLNPFNESVAVLTESMITTVMESESVKLENGNMAEYFKKYSTELNKLISRLNQQKSKFAINMEVYIDANNSVVDDLISCTLKQVMYNKTIFKNLTDKSVPNISPKKIFKREYRVLGKALQDVKSSDKTDADRINIITTVYNALESSIGSNWLDTCVKVITDNEDCNPDEFSEAMYRKFNVGKKPVVVNEVEINQAKYVLSTASLMSRQIQESFDILTEDIVCIINELSNIWANHDNNALRIDTDADGVADATYHLTDYSMSCFDKIIKTKIDQLNEVVNLYLIALSIKMDCMLKSLNQANEIITIASTGVAPDLDLDTTDNGDYSYEFDDDIDIEFPEFDGEGENQTESEPYQSTEEGPDTQYDGAEEPVTEGVISNIALLKRNKWFFDSYNAVDVSGIIPSTKKLYVVNHVKQHKNPDYIKLIDDCQNKKELAYVYKFIKADIVSLPKIRKILSGNDFEKYAAGATQHYISGGNNGGYSVNLFTDANATPEDIDKYLDWINSVAIPKYEKKKESFSKAKNESVVLVDEEADFEKSCYMMELEMSRMSSLMEQLDMHNTVYRILTEADTYPTNSQVPLPTASPKKSEQTNNNASSSGNSSSNNGTTVTKVEPSDKSGSSSDKDSKDDGVSVTKVNAAAKKNSSEWHQKMNEIKEKMHNLIASLVNKIRELVNKFMDVVVNKNKSRVEEIKNNKKNIIANAGKGAGTWMPYNTGYIKTMEINLDFAKYRDVLNSENDYIKQAFKIKLEDGKSFKDYLTEQVVGKKAENVTAQTISNGLAYITQDFEAIVNSIRREQNTITTRSKNVKVEAEKYMSESTLESTMLNYFLEFDAPTAEKPADNTENKDGTTGATDNGKRGEISKKMLTMYRINGTMLTTKMSLAQKAFNEYYTICKFFMNNKVGELTGNEQSSENNSEESTNTENK